jgi:hypothetical protein
MTNHGKRFTLICTGTPYPDREWNTRAHAPTRLIVIQNIDVLALALENGVAERDVERVVVDRAAPATRFLEMLAALPADFAGDVLFIRHDERAFLSATGHGGNRVIYALSAADLDFYLRTHGLVETPGVPLLALQIA